MSLQKMRPAGDPAFGVSQCLLTSPPNQPPILPRNATMLLFRQQQLPVKSRIKPYLPVLTFHSCKAPPSEPTSTLFRYVGGCASAVGMNPPSSAASHVAVPPAPSPSCPFGCRCCLLPEPVFGRCLRFQAFRRPSSQRETSVFPTHSRKRTWNHNIAANTAAEHVYSRLHGGGTNWGAEWTTRNQLCIALPLSEQFRPQKKRSRCCCKKPPPARERKANGCAEPTVVE